MIKIAIGIPTQGTIKSQTAYSLMEMVRLNDYEFLPIFRYGGYIAENRGKIVEIAQDNLCSHVLFIDHDMVFSADLIKKLIEHDKDIIGVNYNYRFLPLTTMTVFYDKFGKETKEIAIMPIDIFEVASVGGGCVLIKMSVFDNLKRPYFEMEQDEYNNRVVTEDFGFLNKAKAVGYKVFCDPNIEVGHLGDFNF